MPRPRSFLAGRAALATAFALFVLIGILGKSAAKPPLGPRGWAPGALPWALGPAATSVALAAAYVLGAVGVVLALRDPRPARPTVIAALAIAALVTMPFGSADHTNYAAYGRIALLGGDPWVESPIAWGGGHDPVTSGVQPPWQQTPSIYGPVATLAQAVAAWGGGENLRQVVWVWQLLIVLAWLAARWLLRRLFPQHAGRVDALWTLNPVLFATAVLGAHVDLLATAAALAALLLARSHRLTLALAAGLAAGAAIGAKVTAGVVLVAIVAGWVVESRRRLAGPSTGDARSPTRSAGRIALLLLGAGLVVAPTQLWAGPHVFDQLGRSRRSISLATPWRKAYGWFGGALGDSTLRSVIFVAAAIMCLLLAWCLWRIVGPGNGRPGDVAIRLTLVLSLAYAAAAPYSLPWYDQLVWALLPPIVVTALDRLQIARALVLGLAYVPGRVVGMTPAVEAVTLGWRRDAAPAAAVLVWLALAWLASTSSSVRRRPRAG
ncbi:MAG: hypothetical protein V9G19_11540 [Tetrasphaera sp.]